MKTYFRYWFKTLPKSGQLNQLLLGAFFVILAETFFFITKSSIINLLVFFGVTLYGWYKFFTAIDAHNAWLRKEALSQHVMPRLVYQELMGGLKRKEKIDTFGKTTVGKR